MFEEILSAIKSSNRIIIHRHKVPDGDALGSQLGLKRILRHNFPEKEIYAVGDDSRFSEVMNDSQMDSLTDDAFRGALCIILDTSAPHLIADGRYTLAEKTLRIDHHLFIDKIADIEVIDSSFESCCGMIAAFAMESNLSVPAAAAKALYTGMVTDSGRFRYDATTPRTLQLAAFLLAQGFDLNGLYRELYAEDLAQKQRKAYFISKIQCRNRVAHIYTDLEEFKRLNTDAFSISRGMVNTMSDIRGVDIWVNFTETDEGVLCELRSSCYNINPIAVKYGGGGHAKASGATVASKQAAMEMLRDLENLIGEKA